MAPEKKADLGTSGQSGVSDDEVRKQSSKVAKQATEAHDKATELMKAAAAAGDPEERQKLMEQALEQQIQSGSLGKTAKYLRSGTFQGMAVGAGLGIAPGASLGTITGTLVGGVSSTALGGLGAGLGAATGWLHGPFWDISKGAGKGIQKITGNIPGWKATESQKKQLEKMVGQINEQDAPGQDELESWGSESISKDQEEAIGKVRSKVPSMPSTGFSRNLDKQAGSTDKKGGKACSEAEDSERNGPVKALNEGSCGNVGENQNKQEETYDVQQHYDQEQRPDEASPQQEAPQETQSMYKDAAVQTEEKGRKKPRKLQTRSDSGNAPLGRPESHRRQPRKLEKRSI